MAEVEKWLADRLKATGDVTALIGQRVYAVFIPQGCVFPAIEFGRAKTSRDYTTLENDGHPDATLQVRLVGNDYDVLKALSPAVRIALEAQLGDFAPYRIEGVFIDDQRDEAYQPVTGDGEWLPSVVFDVRINHTEQTASGA